VAIDMSQFYQAFFEESVEHLDAMEHLLIDLSVDQPDPEDLNAIFRAAHSIKGSAGTFGFTDLANTTHILENLLDRIRKGDLAIRSDMVDAFLQAGDLLKLMLEAHQGRGVIDQSQVKELCDRLRDMSVDAPATPAVQTKAITVPDAAASIARVFRIEFLPTERAVNDQGLNNLLEELATFGSLEVENRPDATSAPNTMWRVRLSTAQDQSTFTEQLDFIADNGAWRVEELPPSEGLDDPFGLFADAPGTPTDDSGFGFFEPLPAAELGAESASAPAGEEGDGFGLFAPLPSPAAAPPASSVEEEGDGFGFFAPLPQSVPPPVDQQPVAAAPEPPPARTEAITNKPTQPNAAAPAQRTPAAASGDSSIRVGIEKVDQLINLVGELVITQAMLLQTAVQMQESAPESLMLGLTQLERNTRDLQESVMSIRMLPISFVFSRFPRVVRDLSSKLGKLVELKTTGETTELDKSLIERIADPLTHLIRNSLDHGIELPAVREAAGKNPIGTITLKAYHQGGNIVIEVGDDGAGINRQRILAKARERGLQVSDQMTDTEVFGLIFDAGFSTAEVVTDVSGRGVGMDVVRRNIQAMGGRVEIESMLGIGTRMTVRLPLTLAILDGMSVAVGDQIYILPLSAVVESLQPKPGDIKTMANKGRVIQVRGDYLPLLVLHEVFGLESATTDFTQGVMVILDADGCKAALFVDELVGQHQVVIKSLEANYRRVPGISGATIMGDGHVAMILDASAITGMTRTNQQQTK
jgi:two-component system chemotaxis sensor kinase CheA